MLCMTVVCLASIFGCGGGSSSTGSPPVTPPPSGPASGTEFIYSFGGDVQVTTLNPATGAVGPITDATPNLFPLIENGVGISLGKLIFVLGFDQYHATQATWVFEITGANGELTLMREGSIFANAILKDATHQRVYGFNSSLGSQDATVFTITTYGVDSTTGALTDQASTSETLPLGTFVAEAMDPAGRFLYTCALTPAGVEVYSYAINASTGALTSAPGSPFLVVPVTSNGTSSLVQLIVNPSGNYLDLFFEGNPTEPAPTTGSLYALSVNGSTGALASIAGSPFPLDDPTMIPLTMSPGGNFLYVPSCVSAPGPTNCISTFAVDPSSGVLNPTVLSSVSGNFGAFDSFDPSGGIFVSLGDSNQGVLAWSFAFNQTTGTISLVQGAPFPLVNESTPNWLSYQSSLIVKVP